MREEAILNAAGGSIQVKKKKRFEEKNEFLREP